MKVVAKPIDMVLWVDKEGTINPVRFRIINEEESTAVIKVDKIICRDKERLNGNIMYIFKCQSCINGVQRMFELKYELETCRWMLWKI